jgi:tetratricopeptide (TPR) repeat protein
MNLKKIITIFLALCCISSGLYAFPLKKLKKGDTVNVERLNPVNIKGVAFKNNKKMKIVFIWRHDKRLSKKSAKRFVKVCKNRKINCISIETKNAPLEVISKILGDIPDNIYFAKNIEMIKGWGIFTLPVTIFLDKYDKIIDAIGYEGQYVVKVERFIDFLEGKISKEELEKLASSPVNNKRSILPDLNYILRLLKENQRDDAIKKLDEIKSKLKVEKLDEFEKVKYAFVLMKLKRFSEASEILKQTKNNDIKSKFYKGVVLYKTGDADKALELFKKIEKIYPDKKSVYFYLGKIYKDKGDCLNAVNYFEKAFNYIDIGF